MKVEVLRSFEKDIAKVKEKKLALQLTIVIEQLERSKTLSEISHLKKMAAKGNYYRIRIGDYRLGFKAFKDTLILIRFMHRKEVYKYFP